MRMVIPFRNRVRFSGVELAVLWCVAILLYQPSSLTAAESPHDTHNPGAAHESILKESDSQHSGVTSSGWDGSVEGKAYSEFNHRLAGALVMLIGLGELHGGLGAGILSWTRFLLPGAMLAAGSYLLIWSDHDAWPLGPKTFMETFFGDNISMLQHKLYALLLLTVGTIELFRRSGRLVPGYWSLPLPTFAVTAGVAIFLHIHSDHPSAHEIARHHATMGVTALMAGSSLIASEFTRTRPAALGFGSQLRSRWKLAWGILVFTIGIQLLLYVE